MTEELVFDSCLERNFSFVQVSLLSVGPLQQLLQWVKQLGMSLTPHLLPMLGMYCAIQGAEKLHAQTL
jgi:hypothetical protein